MGTTNRPRLSSLLRQREQGQCSAVRFERSLTKSGRERRVQDVAPLHYLSLAESPELISPHRTAITSLDADLPTSRFVLAGSKDATISIYDVSKWGSEYKNPHRFRPVAQSLRMSSSQATEEAYLSIPTGHSSSILHVQWYPTDTGAFISSALDGSLLIWDTNAMKPVFGTKLRFGNNDLVPSGLSSTHLQPIGSCSLVACASRESPFVKLCDLRSGSTSHTLTDASRKSMNQSGGITAVQWSLTHEWLLASGSSDGQRLCLWDIRKSGSRARLCQLDRGVMAIPDSSGARSPMYGDYSHWNCSFSASASAHGAAIGRIRFSADGLMMTSLSVDGELLSWDLSCRPQPSRRPVQCSMSPGRPFAAPSLRKFKGCPPLCLQERDGMTSWTASDGTLLGYDMQTGGPPIWKGRGSLEGITTICQLPHTFQIISGSRDGMLLTWDQQFSSSASRGRKRRTRDQDNW